ncbi:MAG: 50S ribosomal protein L11 methyltransferase [Gammaproteobacteria bacterium]|nr:50S ribosomal protein L11 methyltransferase [Gammaproteobacteria bacterium]
MTDSWQQIHITIPKEQLQELEEFLLSIGSLSVTYKDAGDNPILEPLPGETPLWPELIVTALFDRKKNINTVMNILARHYPQLTASNDELEDQDWERSWMKDYQPMSFGQRLWVVPTEMQVPDEHAVNLRLDPGLAFGTGTHPTTALCLHWLDQHDVNNLSILDYGCGSGILAVAGLLLGASMADAVDIDPQAISASKANAINNHVDHTLGVYLVADFKPRQYDIVMANILSGPLSELAPDLSAFTKPSGHIILSGILQQQAESLHTVYQQWFKMDDIIIKDGWALLSGRKKNKG